MRFVGRWAQDPNPLTNQGLRYVDQGLTNDARYLVSFFYSFMSPALAADASKVPTDELAQLNADPSAYLASRAAMLDSLPPELSLRSSQGGARRTGCSREARVWSYSWQLAAHAYASIWLGQERQ